jgi:chorismate mutase
MSVETPGADSNPLSLENIRSALARLDETIIFGLIERVQFCRNNIIYRKDGLGKELGGESLVDFLLHETERAQAKVRRYTSPDEHPFFKDLPAPLLPPLKYDTPLHPNAVNINDRLRAIYEEEIIPFICRPGDDRQWGSSGVNDVLLLQALSKRIHYGKFVAESKYRSNAAVFASLIRTRDRAGLLAAVTDASMEAQVLDRVYHKTDTYGHEVGAAKGQAAVDAAKVRAIYERWIIPLNKEVQVCYLLERPLP